MKTDEKILEIETNTEATSESETYLEKMLLLRSCSFDSKRSI